MSNSEVDLMMVITRSLDDQGFPRKNRRVMGPGLMGLDLLEISNNYCRVMDAFRGLKLIICRDLGLI